MKGAIVEGGGDEKEVAGLEGAAGRLDGAGEEGEDGEGAGGSGFARSGEGPAFDVEMGAVDEGLAGGLLEGGLEVGEVDGAEGLWEVELAGLAIEAGAAPIEDAIGGVAVLLDFDDEVAGADGVDAAAGDEDEIAGGDGDAMDCGVGGAGLDGGLKRGAGDAVTKAGEDAFAAIVFEDVPHLGLGLAAKGLGGVSGGMDLEGEAFACIEEFEEEGETGGLRGGLAEDGGAMGGPEVVESEAIEGASLDDALGLGAVDDFPGFANGLGARREGFAEGGLEAAAAPDARHEDGFEGDGGEPHGESIRQGKAALKGKNRQA